MNDIAIKVENLGKKYVIDHEFGKSDDNFREVIIGKTKKLFNKLNPFSPSIKKEKEHTKEDFWALNDVNFEIKKGDKVGIIGRNGAGKSTLLKVLSRITEPTTGKVHINGRIASLLEVGTGFHPELTGRENIYLNGAILGMSRKEIKAKFDEIVAFAEVDKFLDTPVKRYSSGMYVRLAFAVAAHLESEILVIDEVLAVGDAAFQKKCLGKMNEVSKEGRTILFVSHNMNAIQQLCNKAILLDAGAVSYLDDNIASVISRYFEYGSTSNSYWKNADEKFNNDYFTPLSMKIVNNEGEIQAMPLTNNNDYFLKIEGLVKVPSQALTIGYCIYTEDGLPLYWSYQTDVAESKWPELKPGRNILKSKLPKNLLNEGTYTIELIGGLHFIEWLFEPRKLVPSIFIEIQGGLSLSPYYTHKRSTILAPILNWKITNV